MFLLSLSQGETECNAWIIVLQMVEYNDPVKFRERVFSTYIGPVS